MATDSTEMIGVECSIPLRGVGLMLLGGKMTGISTVQGEGFQLTPENQASTRDPLSCRGWSTGTEPIEVHSTEMYPQAVECMFLALNVSAGLSEPQLSLPTSGWRLESVSSTVSLSPILGLRTTEWLSRSASEMTRWP